MNYKGEFDISGKLIKIRKDLFIYMGFFNNKNIRLYFINDYFTIVDAPENFCITEEDTQSTVMPDVQNFYNLYTDCNYKLIFDGKEILCLKSVSKWIISGLPELEIKSF